MQSYSMHLDETKYWITKEIEALSEKEGNQSDRISALKVKRQQVPPFDIYQEVKEVEDQLLNEEKTRIVKEKSQIYYGKEISEITEEEVDNYIGAEHYPLKRFLLLKRKYLKTRINAINNELPYSPTEEKEDQPSFLKSVFDVAKKVIDLTDDAWNVIKGALPSNTPTNIGPAITGAVGFIVHFREGYDGLKLLIETLLNEKSKQRKTKLISGALTFLLAGSGFGLGVSLFVGALGAAVAAMTILPSLVCGFLTGIYSLALWRRSYIFHRSKQDELEENINYQLYCETELKKDTQRLEVLSSEINDLESSSLGFLEKEQKIQQYKIEYAQISGKIEGKKKRHAHFCEERLKAERNVAFGTIEVTASALVLVGTILGGAIIIGSSIATFGIAPLALLITGVVAGVLGKYFEAKDEKENYKYSRSIRSWFVEKWNKLTNKPTPKASKYISFEQVIQREKTSAADTKSIFKTVGVPSSESKADIAETIAKVTSIMPTPIPVLKPIDVSKESSEKNHCRIC